MSQERISRFDQGLVLVKSDHFEEALPYFEQSILYDKQVDKSKAFYWLGECYYSLEDYPMALQYYDLSVDEDNNNSQVLFDRGYLLAKLKHFDRAILDFTKCISANSELPWPYFHRGWCMYHKKQYSNAVNDITTAMNKLQVQDNSIETDNVTRDEMSSWLYEALTHNAKVSLKEGDYLSVINTVDRILEIRSDSVKYIIMKGQAYAELKMVEEAVEVFTYAMEVDPRDETPLLHRASAFMKLGYYDSSIEDYENVLMNNSNSEKARIGIDRVMNARQQAMMKLVEDHEKDNPNLAG